MTIAQPGGLNGYFGKYFQGYFGALPYLIDPNPIAGLNYIIGTAMQGYTLQNILGKGGDLAAHAAARKLANANMLTPGSAAWDAAYKTAISTGIDVFWRRSSYFRYL